MNVLRALKLANMPHISIFDADSNATLNKKHAFYDMVTVLRAKRRQAKWKTNHFGCFCHKVFCRLIKMSAILNGRHDSKWSDA